MKTITKSVLKEAYPRRPFHSHKYDFGLLLVIGGSRFYTGSPAFSALAAFRSGVDMVHVISPKRSSDIIASFSPNLASFPLEGKRIGKDHLSALLSMTKSAEAVSKGKTAVVIGGGMGRSEETQKVILDYLSQTTIPVILDADGIHAVSGKKEVLKEKRCLFTPHEKEFEVLTGKDVSELPFEDRKRVVREQAGVLKSVILLKGEKDIISDGKETAVCKKGNSFMTVGGTGDVLAGIAGALMAKGLKPFLSAQAAAFISGSAGERAAKKYGVSLLATDVIEEIPSLLK